MKKITKTFSMTLIFCLALIQTFNAQAAYKLDSIQNFNWDESFMALQMTIRQHYTYANEGANYTNFLHMLKTDGNWVNNQQINNTQNNLGLTLVSTNQTWDSNTNEWIDSFRFFNSYTDFNAPESNVVQLWDNFSNIWLYLHKEDYLYNDAQQQTKLSFYLSENSQDVWIPFDENETVYDEDGRTLANIFRNYDTDLMQMVNDKQIIYTVLNGVLSERIFQEWDTNQWINSSKTAFAYENDLNIQTNDFIWENDDWEPVIQTNYTFNGNSQIETSTTLYYFNASFQNYSRLHYTYTNNHITQWIFQSWDVGLNDWRNTQKWNDVYDTNNNLTESYKYTWDTDTNDWKENIKTLNYYSEIMPISLSVASNDILETKIYPNPVSDFITVKTMSSIKTIEMYNTMGKLLLTTNKSTFKVDAFQNGLYLLKIETDKGKITKKVVIK